VLSEVDEALGAFLRRQRVAHLATADAQGWPHVVPVCFVLWRGRIYIAIDEKPKRTTRLKRLRNIAENPHVALVADRYDEDWSRLAYLLVRGVARVLERGDARPAALRALRRKYPQYASMRLESRPLIEISPTHVTAWGAL